jgi:pilus assembly protein CpaF
MSAALTQPLVGASSEAMSIFVFVKERDADYKKLTISKVPFTIGKHPDCDVVIDSWRVAKIHAEVTRGDVGLRLADKNTFSGTWVNQDRITGTYGPLADSDEIEIAGFKLKIVVPVGAISRQRPVIPRNGSAQTVSGASDQGFTSELQQAATPAVFEAELPTPALDETENSAAEQLESAEYLERFEWRKRVHNALIQTMDLRRKDISSMSDEALRKETGALILEILQTKVDLPRNVDEKQLVKEVLDEAIGLGPLESLLADPSVSEIMVNSATQVYVERKGRLERCNVSFTSDDAVYRIIERIVSPLGRRIDESSPMVDGRLKDGSRVNAIIPPLALKGPTLTIRKFMQKRLTDREIIGMGSANKPMMEFLRICVEQRKNIVVSGGTGTGKTTLLNVLSNFIPARERIVTIEDSAELKLYHPHLISLESRPANMQGAGGVAIRDLVKNTLRMRPDRIVVGECRGGEALDMLQAMNTGHDGSLTTVHANTPRDVISRIEVMALMAGVEIPMSAIREQIAAAVDIVVQLTRNYDGSRRITSVTEVSGMESGRIQMAEVFSWAQTGRDETGRAIGHYTGCDYVPSFYEDLARTGVVTDLSIFDRTPV